MPLPRISAYSLSCEPDEVMLPYLDFMAGAGVFELIMFFDGPISPGLAAAIAAREGGPMRIRAEVLDDACWARALGDEVTMRRKFAHCIARAHAEMSGDWLWVADPDEFPEDPAAVFAALDRVGPSVDAVILPPAEAVWGPDEAEAPPLTTRTFRVPRRRRHLGWWLLRRLIYGRWHVFFQEAMLGHVAGKHFVRRGARVDRFSSHRPYRDGAKFGVPLAEAAGLARPLHVLHYDAVCYDRWMMKMQRRVRRGRAAFSTDRRNQLAQIALVEDLLRRMEAAGDPAEARRIGERAFRRLYHLTPMQHRLLRLIGGVVTLPAARRVPSCRP